MTSPTIQAIITRLLEDRKLSEIAADLSCSQTAVECVLLDSLRSNDGMSVSAADSQAGTVELFVDGGARGNPGPAGIGIVLRRNGIVIADYGEYIGEQTNNVAEYTALIKGISFCRERGWQHVRIFSDSELMVKQLQGNYKVKSKNLLPLFMQARRALEQMAAWSITHIKRELNSLADSMVNQAIDAHTIL